MSRGNLYIGLITVIALCSGGLLLYELRESSVKNAPSLGFAAPSVNKVIDRSVVAAAPVPIALMGSAASPSGATGYKQAAHNAAYTERRVYVKKVVLRRHYRQHHYHHHHGHFHLGRAVRHVVGAPFSIFRRF